MKVIYAGFAKTGTKTMGAVFREFGYKTYDWIENSWYLSDDWTKILEEGGTVEDFRRMYKGVDAVVDGPCFMFWEEILEAFPDAKIIFSSRDEGDWVRSLTKTLDALPSEPKYVLMQSLSYSGWKHFEFTSACVQMELGSKQKWPWSNCQHNETVWRRMYRNHNACVLQNAPKKQLLVYDFKDGWGPICEFLGEKVPDKPFPHANIGASILKDYIENHPIMKRMMREAMFTLGVLTLIGAYGGYKVYQNPASIRGWINAAMTRFKFW
uniref:uncharacterized protein LOC101243268 isoform X1 n=1 Tax=Ciona intestinalis TaxID=7719 RepID=UPI000EF518D3|nr:uncharacterized protein LOC101243268 isoform X1 [Ciona intestinalis]XP_026693989.1 uncharacterized protein LOC101243268 isoform X2 [Ciona intestinalis]|eukprot:XP_009862142.2 uncharacterized protein LOC101243268 isoform X1 [Ciona intestinalis]